MNHAMRRAIEPEAASSGAPEAPEAPEAPDGSPSSPNPHDERRREPRMRMDAFVTGTSETTFFSGRTENVSEGGVYIATLSPPGIGEHVSLRVQAEPHRFLMVEVEGQVAWHRIDQKGDVIGCGVAFVQPDPVARYLLHLLVSRSNRTPLLWDV